MGKRHTTHAFAVRLSKHINKYKLYVCVPGEKQYDRRGDEELFFFPFFLYAFGDNIRFSMDTRHQEVVVVVVVVVAEAETETEVGTCKKLMASRHQ
jgi:hypothetical protein